MTTLVVDTLRFDTSAVYPGWQSPLIRPWKPRARLAGCHGFAPGVHGSIPEGGSIVQHSTENPPELHRNPEEAVEMAVNAVIHLYQSGIKDHGEKRLWIDKVVREIQSKLAH
jgi:hypothetical protein